MQPCTALQNPAKHTCSRSTLYCKLYARNTSITQLSPYTDIHARAHKIIRSNWHYCLSSYQNAPFSQTKNTFSYC